jgi:hypothetical protein
VRKLIRGAYDEILETESEVCVDHRSIFSRTMCGPAE